MNVVDYNLFVSLWLFSSILTSTWELYKSSLACLEIICFECSLSSLNFFKYSWNNFGRALMLGEFISNELGIECLYGFIYSDLMNKSPLETSTLEITWLILIGQKSKSPNIFNKYQPIYLNTDLILQNSLGCGFHIALIPSDVLQIQKIKG